MEEEHWNEWEEESDPVLGETNVDDTVSLERGECAPVSLVRWLLAKWDSLFSETLNILVDSALHLWLELGHLVPNFFDQGGPKVTGIRSN